MGARGSAADPSVELQRLSGERPNLWWAESAPNHHYMFQDLKAATKALSDAELFVAVLALMRRAGRRADAENTIDMPDISEMRNMTHLAWQNVTIQDHGFGHEISPLDSLPRESHELDFLINERSPHTADLLYKEKWAYSRATAEAVLQRSLDAIADFVLGENSTGGALASSSSLRFVVFNSQNWARRREVEVRISSKVLQEKCPDARLEQRRSWKGAVREAGAAKGWQRVTAAVEDQDATFVFIPPTTIPPLGYATFELELQDCFGSVRTDAQLPDKVKSNRDWLTVAEAKGDASEIALETEFFNITLLPGGVKSIVDKSASPPAELIDSSHLLAGNYTESVDYTSNSNSVRVPTQVSGSL